MVEEAYRELTGERHRAQNLAVMVLLSDGRANPEPVALAVEWAALAKREGIVVFTIGLGDDVDTAGLQAMASQADYYYPTAESTDLAAVFRRIAGSIPCPAVSFWGGR